MKQQMELVSRFYGVNLDAIPVRTARDQVLVRFALRQKNVVAAVITGDVLPLLNRRNVIVYLRRDYRRSIPLLIAEINHDTDAAALRRWSQGRIVLEPSILAFSTGTLQFSPDSNDLAHELAGESLPVTNVRLSALYLVGGPKSRRIIEFQGGGRLELLFATINRRGHEMFFQSEFQYTSPSSKPILRGLPRLFSEVVPLLMFVRYAAGEHAWHSPGRYANLTIDDAWLVEPYGNLSYKGLLADMERHHFHSTVAFIPWNFDRSYADVVDLIQTHPMLFSICVHGDNHDHAEFRAPDTVQAEASKIKQAVARMERFKELTGIPYDRVMIYPHETPAPVEVLDKLKEYNFIAGMSAALVPAGEKDPGDPLLLLRPMTLLFGNFLEVQRSPAQRTIPRWEIAVQAFLESPILYYVHEAFFAQGMGAFDGIVDVVNQLDPETSWVGLQDVARHSYLLRLRDDGDFDVNSFSGDIRLENNSQRQITYFVRKAESGHPPISSMTLNDKPLTYTLADGYLSFAIRIPAKSSMRAAVTYQNDLNAKAVDLRTHSLRVDLLRLASDFRDRLLSRSRLGRFVINAYYDHLASAEIRLEHILSNTGVHIMVALSVLVGYVLVVRVRRKRSGHTRREINNPYKVRGK